MINPEDKKLFSPVKNYIENAKYEGKASHVSVYYFDLTSSEYIGIGEDENYVPASLIKLPVMIAVLKLSEVTPGLLQKKIQYTQRKNNHMISFYSDDEIILGQTYTVEELLERMIVNSDNQALYQLTDYVLNNDFFNKMMINFNMQHEIVKYFEDNISPEQYSRFFKALYKGLYLNKANSEKALKLLSESHFQEGLKKNLPENVLVANKFGERFYPGTHVRQLHDCGIVYKEDKPYLICIMTRGKDFNELSTIIGDISNMVFNNVE